jgi:DNA primase
VDAILGVMALAPELPGQAGQVKQELLVTRLAQRLGLRQETVWARFAELKQARKKEGTRTPPDRSGSQPSTDAPRAKPARAVEKELLQILLAEPGLVGQAYVDVRPEEVEHPGLQQLLGGLYRLHEAGEPPTLDGLRDLVEHAALIDWAMDQQEIGRNAPDRAVWFRGVLERFRAERVALRRKQLMDRLRAATADGERQRLLREIQDLDRAPATSAGRPSP